MHSYKQQRVVGTHVRVILWVRWRGAAIEIATSTLPSEAEK